MSYYVIAQFETKEAAETFAFAQKDTQMEVVERDRHDNQHRYEDVQVVVEAYADLTDEQRNQIDVAKIVEQLSDFDYSDYNEHIESLIDTQLNPK
ncbi:hypothetical protein [Psychrobacillus sp. NPDC093200]|uniref:hypothetical protein n=1 Tax=Psychrobacillus sp. NPDC093200 TaxID=3390656 RepID=UPI0011A5B383